MAKQTVGVFVNHASDPREKKVGPYPPLGNAPVFDFPLPPVYHPFGS